MTARISTLAVIIGILAAFFIVVFASSKADAFRRQTTITGLAGRSATMSTTGCRAPGHGSRSATVTGPRGNTVTGSTTVTRAPGNIHRSTTVTGPYGGSTEGSTAVTVTPGAGVQASTAITGPGGSQVHRSSEGSWDPATRTWDRSVTTTGPAGNSFTTTRSTRVSQ